jgi:hypothetical protein
MSCKLRCSCKSKTRIVEQGNSNCSIFVKPSKSREAVGGKRINKHLMEMKHPSVYRMVLHCRRDTCRKRFHFIGRSKSVVLWRIKKFNSL